MPQTPLTTPVPYCPPGEFLAGQQRHAVADLLVQGDEPRPTRAALLDPLSEPGRAVLVALLTASGEVEKACVAGGRYTPADLLALTGAGLAVLQRLVADLALWHLHKAKYRATADPRRTPGTEAAFEDLQRLRTGERVFPFAETADAGVSHPVGYGLVNGVRVYLPGREPDDYHGRGRDDRLGRLFGYR